MTWYEGFGAIGMCYGAAAAPLRGEGTTIPARQGEVESDPESELLALGVKLKTLEELCYDRNEWATPGEQCDKLLASRVQLEGLHEYNKKDWMSPRERSLGVLSRHRKLSVVLAGVAVVATAIGSDPAMTQEGWHSIQGPAAAALDGLVQGFERDLSIGTSSNHAYGATSIPTLSLVNPSQLSRTL